MEGLQSFIVRMLQTSVAMSRLLLTQQTKCVLASSRHRKQRTKRFVIQKISALYQPLIFQLFKYTFNECIMFGAEHFELSVITNDYHDYIDIF